MRVPSHIAAAISTFAIAIRWRALAEARNTPRAELAAFDSDVQKARIGLEAVICAMADSQ